MGPKGLSPASNPSAPGMLDAHLGGKNILCVGSEILADRDEMS